MIILNFIYKLVEKYCTCVWSIRCQGDVVRKLKTEKVDKAKIEAEVALLLSLKKQLTIAEGAAVTQPSSASSAQPASKQAASKGRKGQKAH